MDQPYTLVVGGSAGIGGALAADLGDRAEVWSRRLGVDAADPASVQRAKDELLARRGVPSGLVHTVGDFCERPLLATTVADYEHLLRSNLTSTLVVVQALAPAMAAARRGRIVLFAAAGAGRPRAITRAPVYFAVKAAVVSLARSLAAELAPSGVTVNVVSPGLIAHPGSHADSQARLRARVPLGRLGTPQDLLPLLRWLLGPDSSYTTGEEFTVDGGLQL